MSKLHLIQEIETAMKMVTSDFDRVKLAHYLDDLLSNYNVKEKEYLEVKVDNASYIKMYLDTLKVENYSESTLTCYGYELNKFSRFIDKSLLRVDTATVRTYLASLDGLKASSITTKLDVISSFYKWLVLEEELLKNPCDKIKRPKLPQRVREGLTVVELERVRLACEDSRQRALIELFYSTGCRLDEIRKINIEDIDWVEGSVLVVGKGNKQRRVYLSDKAVWYIQKYLNTRDDGCEALIVSVRTPIRRLTNEGIQYQIKKIKKSAGLDKPFHPHILRHTFAQLSLDAGMELSDLQALMGHTNPNTTLRYAEASEERKQVAFKRFHQQ